MSQFEFVIVFLVLPRLPLRGSWRGAPERARPLMWNRRHSDSLALTKALLIAARCLCITGLALSVCCADTSPKGRGFLLTVKPSFVQPLRHGFAVPPPLVGEALAFRSALPLRQRLPYQGQLYGDNVFEKDGIRRDRTGDGEKTRCLCGKRGIFNRDGPAMGPQIIRQLERRASKRSASFFHALASPGRPRNGGGASGAYQPAEGRKPLIQGHFRAQEGPLGPSRKSQQQTKRTGFAALEDSIADEAPEGKRAKRANRALNRAGINSRGQKQGFGGADRRAGRVTSR